MVSLPKYVCICLVVMLVSVWVAPVQAQATAEDAALFQEALAPYGQWLQHNRYGLVWRPSRVERTWRPYTNGRWVLTDDGYVFETDEPWGWATYHYGNWQNTPEHGWIWIPGRTWYPHTVTWRANDEHVGWAPVPPPDVANADLSWQGNYASRSDYGSPGYATASLPASSWIFTRARDFLYGWGEPYSSQYSYYNAGLLAAPQYVPVIYERTVYIYNYVTPAYAPRACYNWGPPVTYITKVTHINQRDIHQRSQRHRLHYLHNALPPKHVLDRHPAWRQLVPVGTGDSHRPGRWWTPVQTRNAALNRPDALPLPASWSRQAPSRSGRPGAPAPPAVAATPTTPPAAAKPGESSGVQPVGKPPLNAGRMSTSPEKPQLGQHPARVSPTADRVTAPQQPAPPLASTSPPRGPAPQGGEPVTAPRRPQPDILRPQPAPATGTTTVSGTPPQPPAIMTPPAARPGRPGDGEALPPQSADRRRWQQEQERRQQQEHEVRQQTIRRQQQEQQQRQGMIRRQQQEQERQAEMVRQQQEEQRRLAELLRQQQAQQQQRQAEMIRQQQMQQQRQIEMVRQQQEHQRRQAEMIRQQQAQQQRQAEMIRQQQQQAAIQQQQQGRGQHAPATEGQPRRKRLE